MVDLHRLQRCRSRNHIDHDPEEPTYETL
jgi:hypothetical protein